MTKKSRYILYGVILISFLFLVYIMINYGNGLIGNWAESLFISTYYDANGAQHTIFNWLTFKAFLLLLGALIICLIVIATFLLTRYFTKTNQTNTIKKLSENIDLFMKSDLTDANFFPEEFSQIGFTMAKVKAQQITQEEKIKKENQQKQDLITYLAHDLKTPLASVIGYLNLLQEAPDLPIELRAKYTNIVLEKAYRLEQLTNEFFEISRYSLHTLALNETSFNLSLLLEQVTEEMYPLLEAKQQRVSLINEAKTTQINGDADQLSRVFDNLLKNASTYGNPHSTIEIEIKEDQEALHIAVKNDGPKLSEQQLTKVFQKFYRIDHSRSSKTGGSGLGLAIAKQIVEAHGGTISAKSDEKQTTFEVQLPLKQDTAE